MACRLTFLIAAAFLVVLPLVLSAPEPVPVADPHGGYGGYGPGYGHGGYGHGGYGHGGYGHGHGGYGHGHGGYGHGHGHHGHHGHGGYHHG